MITASSSPIMITNRLYNLPETDAGGGARFMCLSLISRALVIALRLAAWTPPAHLPKAAMMASGSQLSTLAACSFFISSGKTIQLNPMMGSRICCPPTRVQPVCDPGHDVLRPRSIVTMLLPCLRRQYIDRFILALHGPRRLHALTSPTCRKMRLGMTTQC
jgi:hypothetical protein